MKPTWVVGWEMIAIENEKFILSFLFGKLTEFHMKKKDDDACHWQKRAQVCVRACPWPWTCKLWSPRLIIIIVIKMMSIPPLKHNGREGECEHVTSKVTPLFSFIQHHHPCEMSDSWRKRESHSLPVSKLEHCVDFTSATLHFPINQSIDSCDRWINNKRGLLLRGRRGNQASILHHFH